MILLLAAVAMSGMLQRVLNDSVQEERVLLVRIDGEIDRAERLTWRGSFPAPQERR
jgi:hypothetical protein